METKILIIIWVSFLLSCNPRPFKQPEIRKDAFKVSDVMSDVFIGEKDSIFTNYILNDNYYSFLFDSERTYHIGWGNENFTNLSNIKYETLGNGNLGLIDFNQDYILLGQSTGTGGANIRVLLPLKKDSKNFDVENVVYFNLTKKIFLIGQHDDDRQFELLNFNSHKLKTIKIIDLCPAIEYTSCIDSVKVNANNLEIYYQGDNWKVNKSDPKLFKVKLN